MPQLAGESADAGGVFRARRTRHDSIAEVLADISPEHLVFDIDHAWLVVGPSGLFVICADTGGPEVATQRAVERAREMRARLADELSWVPFIDALVVSDGPSDDEHLSGPGPQTECPVIPVDMLRYTLVEGPRSLDEDTLAKLALLGFRRSS